MWPNLVKIWLKNHRGTCSFFTGLRFQKIWKNTPGAAFSRVLRVTEK